MAAFGNKWQRAGNILAAEWQRIGSKWQPAWQLLAAQWQRFGNIWQPIGNIWQRARTARAGAVQRASSSAKAFSSNAFLSACGLPAAGCDAAALGGLSRSWASSSRLMISRSLAMSLAISC